MKQISQKIILTLTAIILTLSISGCGLVDNPFDDENDLVGTWEYTEKNVPCYFCTDNTIGYPLNYSFPAIRKYEYTFKKNGSYTDTYSVTCTKCKKTSYESIETGKYKIINSDKHNKVLRLKVFLYDRSEGTDTWSDGNYYFFTNGKKLYYGGYVGEDDDESSEFWYEYISFTGDEIYTKK